MKKSIAFLLALSILVSMAACHVDSGGIESTGSEETSTAQTERQPSVSVPDTEVTLPSGTEPGIEETFPSETVPDTEATAPVETEPATEVTIPQETAPSTQVTIPSTPPTQPGTCSHQYALTGTKASTCTAAGVAKYTCSKCGEVKQEVIAATCHQYAAASCMKPKTCSVCGNTTGSALGHSYSNGTCTRCGASDPSAGPVELTITVKTDEGGRLENVTVLVYSDTSATKPAGTGKTNSSGVATVTLDSMPSSYQVILDNIPAGYSGKESYTFTSTRSNITLTTLAVLDPTDHSRAKYKVGDIMADFTLTDTDGNVYTLSELLLEKKVVVLNFWYVTCNPCNAEFPYFESMYQQYKDDIALLALDPYDGDASIDAHKTLKELSFPMMRDTLGLTQGFRVAAFPTTVFIGSGGKILNIKNGPFANETELLATLKMYLSA